MSDNDTLSGLLRAATAAIAPEYFLLPVATPEGETLLHQYRERVYAYELYHQLRSQWPSKWPYSLAGEVDKVGHPIVRGGELDKAKPDLLVHVPRSMEHNLAAIEIKPLPQEPNANEAARFKDDIRKLIAFRGPTAKYSSALLIVFGEAIDRAMEHGATARADGLEVDRVDLWHHRRAGESAGLVPWRS